ncbi:MAG: 5-(carboxyamino)imidazole ribonucleotide mutase [Armatimonadetes bacterium]|nr:5-(carboxyamino)imidazole ribonucleotide mutase [Armatimonadota bacterium]
MGSDSDLPVMVGAVEVLRELGIETEVRALSAHRTPRRVLEYAESAEARGLRVLIAGAGGAAHLPGVVAALTPLPVIGVPVKSAALDGLDSLLSMVQMPPGVPVATVGVNAARNAGILAAQILGAGDPAIRERVRRFKENQAAAVEAGDRALPERLAALEGGA